MDGTAIPDRPYFRIGQVAELLGLPTHVLRYWEREFPQLNPTRAPSGQRIYRRADVETAFLIRRLLHEEGFTIAGAKKRLDELADAKGPSDGPAKAKPPAQVLGELKDILKLLD